MNEIGLIRGLLTAVLLGAFVALWIWAWSARRKADFEAAAMLPLIESESDHPPASNR
jgi:cytochrome c oxidase cbb3-type subunit 4